MILGITLGVLGLIAFIATICMFAWYVIVDPSEAHLVVTRNKKFVVSADDKVAKGNNKYYFAIPQSIPFFGRAIRMMDVTIKELVTDQETYEKKQARYNVRSSLKYRIVNVETAAETFISDQELKEQLKEVVRASVRAITVKYDVIEARASKQKMSEEITKEMSDDLSKWGLELVNFQLVDFQDTADSKIISDISKRREIEIQSDTREQNAEKVKQAEVKEAIAKEESRSRQIETDRTIAEKEQLKAQMISEQEKTAEEKRFEVVKVRTIKQAEIEKEKAIIEANQSKETEKILMDQKKLEGQGDRARAEERAKGEAAPIREKGFAEAEAKEKLQSALNKFKDEAIRALVAERIVEMQEKVGIESAKALQNADVKVFSGGEGSSKSGFDLGKMLQSMSVSDESTAKAIMNRLARPNDLGLSGLALEGLKNKEGKSSSSLKHPSVLKEESPSKTLKYEESKE